MDVATEIVKGYVDGIGGFDEDGGTDFSTEAFTKYSELTNDSVSIKEANFVVDGVKVAFGGGVDFFANASVEGVVGVFDGAVVLLYACEAVEGVVVVGDITVGCVHDSAVTVTVVLIAIFGVVFDKVKGVNSIGVVVFL